MNTLSPFEAALKNGVIRKTPDSNKICVNDVVMNLTGKTKKEAQKIINRLHDKYLELLPFFGSYSFGRGRPNDVMSAEGIIRLIMVLPGEKAAKFRQDAARLICRYMSADITLADEIIQANKNDPEKLKWIDTRLKGMEVRKNFTDTIKDHGGTGFVYAEVSDINNMAITGKTAKALQHERKVKTTRDGLSTLELSAAMFMENLEAEQLDVREARGNKEIVNVVKDVSSDVGAVMTKHRRKEVAAEATVL